MYSEKGLGDQNMDFLFGLDMLKRHRCKIDLEQSALVFGLPDGQSMESPFLHEKDLYENKGGTRGFDAAKSNADLEKTLEEKQGNDYRQNGDLKEEEETPGKDNRSGQYGAVDSKAMEVDKIDFGDSRQNSTPKVGN